MNFEQQRSLRLVHLCRKHLRTIQSRVLFLGFLDLFSVDCFVYRLLVCFLVLFWYRFLEQLYGVLKFILLPCVVLGSCF